MKIEKQPYAIHPAYNITTLRCSASQDQTIPTAYISITPPETDALIPFSRMNEFHELLCNLGSNEIYADFDLSRNLKQLFQDIRQNIAPYIYLDGNLSFPYRLFCNQSLVGNFTALNAVVQIGQSQDFTTRKGQFLTEFKRLRKYPGYPLCLAFLGNDNNTLLSYDRKNYLYEGDLTWGSTKYFHALLDISDGNKQIAISNAVMYELCDQNADIIANERGEIICVTYPDGNYHEYILPIDNLPVPSSPFYLRWINRLGGYDHYMFAFRQKTERSVSDPLTFVPYHADQENARNHSKVIGIKATEKVTVGAESIPNEDLIPLSEIIYSPRIEYYVEASGKWLELQVDKSSSALDSRNLAGNIEITFLKPDIQTQF